MNSTQWFEEYVNSTENKASILAHKLIMQLAVQIHIEREKKKLSQRQLAQRAGVPQSTIARIEKGRSGSFQTLSKVCMAGFSLNMCL